MIVKSRRRPTVQKQKFPSKGRSSYLLRLRDIHLVKRYYEFSEVQRRRTDDVLMILSTREFFISEQRIWSIIRRNTDLLDLLSKGESIDLSCPPLGDSEDQLTPGSDQS